jgi:choline monooxygenase
MSRSSCTATSAQNHHVLCEKRRVMWLFISSDVQTSSGSDCVPDDEYFSTQGGALKESARDGKLYDVRGEVQAGFYAYLWPNFTINIYPGPGNVSLNLFVPVDTHRTLAIYDYCFADAVSAEEERDFVAFIDQVQEEDVVLCESVQRGLRSGYFDQGKLMLSRERGLRHFQKLVYRLLAE